MKSRSFDTRYLLSLGLSILSALLLGAVVLLIAGFPPLKAYGAIIEGAFGNKRHVGDLLEYAMVLCLCGLACVLGARVGIFNVGGEGQLILGAICACQVGVWMKEQPAWLVLLCAALTAMAVGGFYAFIPGILKVKGKVNEVITTIMLNTVALCLCQYLAKGPWKNPNKNMVAATAQPSADHWLTGLIPGSKLSTAIFSAILITVLLWYVLSKTATGYEMRLTGQNPRFAFFSGIKTHRLILFSMVLSGALCGLVGMFRVYGGEHIYKSSISNDYYFEGLMIAMIAAYEPLPVVGLSLFFAMLKIGADELQYLGIPSQIYQIIQTVVIFAMSAQNGILTLLKGRLPKKTGGSSPQEGRWGR